MPGSSLTQAAFDGAGRQGLGAMWGWETAQETLVDAGFERIERNVLPHDPMNVWFVARAPAAG